VRHPPLSECLAFRIVHGDVRRIQALGRWCSTVATARLSFPQFLTPLAGRQAKTTANAVSATPTFRVFDLFLGRGLAVPLSKHRELFARVWSVYRKQKSMHTHGSDCQRAGFGPLVTLVVFSGVKGRRGLDNGVEADHLMMLRRRKWSVQQEKWLRCLLVRLKKSLTARFSWLGFVLIVVHRVGLLAPEPAP
jgi:hypothetical protein